MSSAEDPILTHVRSAIAANRQIGLQFPGFFLEVEAVHVDKQLSHLAVARGPHNTNANGDLNICTLAVLADMAMSFAMRMHIDDSTRMATTTMHLQFTGAQARADLEMKAHFDGFIQGAKNTQGRVSGPLTSGGELICHASASFATPPAPPGVQIHPLPLAIMGPAHRPAPLPVAQMDENEKNILKAARAALKKTTPEHAFIEHFWPQLATVKEKSARSSFRFGPHVGNRVGILQGGVALGIAAATAMAAVPGARLTGASAWYISPGNGERLTVKSTAVQYGRNIAVMRTDLLAGPRLVLAVMTSHAF